MANLSLVGALFGHTLVVFYRLSKVLPNRVHPLLDNKCSDREYLNDEGEDIYVPCLGFDLITLCFL